MLQAAETAGFGVLVTGDQNLQFQQNLEKRQIGVVVLCGVSTALEDLLPLVPDALKAIEAVRAGHVLLTLHFFDFHLCRLRCKTVFAF